MIELKMEIDSDSSSTPKSVLEQMMLSQRVLAIDTQ